MRHRVRYLAAAIVFALLAAGIVPQALGRGNTVQAAGNYNFFNNYPVYTAKAVTRKPRILLVGNSFSLFENYAGVLEKICKSGGINVHIESVTKAGHTLYGYVHPNKSDPDDAALNRKLMSLLKKQKWDYVILQDQRFAAVKDVSKMRQAVKELQPLIKKAGAQMVLYMTWAPKANHADYTVRRIAKDRNTYQGKIADTYYALAKKYKAALSPAGLAFIRAQKILPDIELFRSDNYHQNTQGCYLSACVMYATLFGRNPENITYYPSIAGKTYQQNKSIGKRLQSLAADVTVRGKVKNSARLSFKPAAVAMSPGEKQALTYKITSEAKGSRIAGWQSNNRAVASVDQSGNVTAHKPGTAVITAILNNGKQAACTVKVRSLTITPSNKKVLIKKLSFVNAKPGAALKKGKTRKLKVKIAPANASIQTLKWSSSNPKIAKVDKNGVVTAVSKGMATIKAMAADGSKSSIKVKIKVVK
ncbi:MAG: Ig-like domain-containing protein [Eubacteriales bacterium]|nr:Ig-like domain-containing protein [Eubacteriales bacterium]